MTNDIHTLPAGTVILTYGRGRPELYHWWQLRYWQERGKNILYGAIRAYQKHLGYSRIGATHVRVIMEPGVFAEATTPKVRIGSTAELAGKRVAVCTPLHTYDVVMAIAWWRSWIGTSYDIAELLDFALSGLKGWISRRLGVLDRVDRFTCSPYAAGGFNAGGFPLTKDWRSITPAYYENKSQLFRVWYFTVPS